MRENGVAATLITATIHDQDAGDWFTFSDTHVLNIVACEGRAYLVDIGFGLKSPRAMVALNGEITTFRDTQHRVASDDSFHYLEHRKLGEPEWKRSYRFARELSPGLQRGSGKEPAHHHFRKRIAVQQEAAGRVLHR